MKSIFVTSPSLPPIDEYVEELKDIWRSKLLTNQGPKYKQLEDEVRSLLGAKHVALFSNGHLSLQIALRSMGLDGGEVITTPFTFASTTQAIVGCGLTPVFCDIEPRTMTIDAEKIRPLISKNTRAILAVHVYGLPCNVAAIQAIADEYGLKVIYDAAHAFGESYMGRPIGTFGDISMFSFHATKSFNTVEGGCLAFSEEGLYERVCALRQFGSYGPYAYSFVGTNAKMSEFHAAMGICNLRHLNEYIAQRKEAFGEYMRRLEGLDGISSIQYPEALVPNYSYFPVVIDEKKFGSTRDDVAKILADSGIYARKYFYPLTSSFECYKGKFDVQDTPIARYISERVLCLPMYAGLSQANVEEIATVLRGCTR